jgi:hypothetical protein
MAGVGGKAIFWQPLRHPKLDLGSSKQPARKRLIRGQLDAPTSDIGWVPKQVWDDEDVYRRVRNFPSLPLSDKS